MAQDATIDEVVLSADAGQTLKIGDPLIVDVVYTDPISPTGTPTLNVKIGTQVRQARCGRSGATKLRCSYTVVEGDATAANTFLAWNDIGVSGTTRRTGDGSIENGQGLPDTDFTEDETTVPAGVTVDGVRLGITSLEVQGSQDTAYTVGEVVQLQVGFDDDITSSLLGSFGVTLVLDGEDRAMSRTAVGGTTVDYSYVVASGDNTSRIVVRYTGTEGLKDSAGNPGLASGAATVAVGTSTRIDTKRPRILSVRGPGANTFRKDQPVPLTVQLSEDITVANSPELEVTVGSVKASAPCNQQGLTPPADTMICTLTIAAGWSDTDGIAIPRNPLRLGGTATIKDRQGLDIEPAFAGEQLRDHKVDGIDPWIKTVTLTPPGTVKENAPVIAKVTFSEPVMLSAGTDHPGLSISVGESSPVMTYIGGTSTVWEYRYSLTSPDIASHTDFKLGFLIPAPTLTGIEDLAGNPLSTTRIDTTFPISIERNVPSRVVEGIKTLNTDDTTKPTALSVRVDGDKKIFRGGEGGDSVVFKVVFSEPIQTAEDLTLELRVGSLTVSLDAGTVAGYELPFTYVVDEEHGGAIRISGLKFNDAEGSYGTLVDNAGNGYTAAPRPEIADERVAGLTYASKTLRTGSVSGYSVDNTPPTVTKVELLRSPPPGAVGKGEDPKRYYGLGDYIRAKLTISEALQRPEANERVTIGTNVSGADGCNSMTLVHVDSSAKVLTFECRVKSGNRALGGLRLNDLANSNDNPLADEAGNPLPLTGSQLGPQLTHPVDGSLSGSQEGVAPIGDDSPQQPQTAPVTTTTVVRSTTPTGGYYKTGDTITIEVSLSPAVTFTSAPQLLVNFDEGGSQRLTPAERISSSGTPTTRLTYSYRVTSGDEDLDGFTASLSGGGTPTVEDGRRATLGSVSVSGIRIDALAPELDSLRITSSAGSDGTYTVGDNIVVSATFSEDVERQGTADPSVPILVGDVTRTATLQSPSSTSGGDTWVFSYKVVAGDNDADGVSIAANALKGDLEDAAGNGADIAHSAVSASTSHKVDTQGPSVTAVEVTGSGDDNLFLEGDTITATVTFDEEVDVARTGSNAVRVQFNIGTSPETATYAGGDGTETLTFTYDVVAGDTGQISLPADALEGQVEDAAGNEAEGTLALSGGPYTVDASAPMLVGAPSISSAPRTGDTYAVDETITLQVRFDEPVMVTGEPRLPIQVGPRPRNIVLYTSGSGTDTLTFSYTVRNGDTDDDGVSVDANALRLPAGAAIADVNGLTAAIEHGELPDQPGHKVDAIAPGIESVAITSMPASDDAYLIDETIAVTVTFSEDIATAGMTTLDLMVGEGVRAAACAQGSASTQLTCSYTVVANDFDPDGISVDADMLKGTITDMVGNPATLTHEALEDDPAHKVYAAAPEAVRTIDRLSLAAGGGTNSLDLTGIFTGFQLSYAAVSSNESVATATVSGTDLTVVSGMEGTARVTVTASNLAGEASVSFDVLVATDPAETAVLNDALAAIGRSMLSSTASVIGSRFELASTGSQMALGGSRFGGSLSPQMQRFLAGNDPFALEERMSERALFSGSGSQQPYGGGYGLTSDRLFTGTSFNMPLNAMGTGDAQFAVWGAGDLQSFEGEPDDGMYDGSSSSGYIGVDARGDGWLAGVSVSRSGAEADYDFDGTARVTGVRGGGTLETSVTAFHPYARLEVGADSEVWVIGGFGGGEADLSRTHVSGSQSSDLSMAMAVGGLRRALAMEFGGADLSLRGDAGFLSLETDSGAMAVDGLSASVSRLRLGLEAAWEGESATPFVEVSGRFDGGDGQTGGGLELAGGLRILNPESGFGLEAKGRILAMHTGDGYSESGIGVTASFEPGAAGRGITFRLSPRWGGSADSTDLFWDEVGNVRDASQYAYGLDRAQTWGVDAALGYGFGLRSMPGVVTPFGQMDVTGAQDQRIRVGVRYGLMQGLLGGTQVELSAERVDGEMHRVGETRVLVSGRARF